MKSGKSLKESINLFLLDYCATPHSTTNQSPAFIMYKRELGTRFNLYKPDTEQYVMKKQGQQIIQKKGGRRVAFSSGDYVMVDDHRVRGNKRAKATVIERLSPVTYLVEISPKERWKRHVDQMVALELNTDSAEDEENSHSTNRDQKNTVTGQPRRSERLKRKRNI